MPCEPLLGRGPDRSEKGGICACSAEKNRMDPIYVAENEFRRFSNVLFLFLDFLWRQPDAPEHLLVPRVRVQRAKPRVAPKMNHRSRAIFICLFQPGEGLIRVAKPRIDPRDLISE